jgi:hypothetical protein
LTLSCSVHAVAVGRQYVFSFFVFKQHFLLFDQTTPSFFEQNTFLCLRKYEVWFQAVKFGSTNRKFIKRFQYLEQAAEKANRKLDEMTLEEMDVYWNEAKTKS